MLKETYDTYVKYASGLGDYQAISKTDLANGYCDAEESHDEIKMNQYYAALVLRYWYKIYEWNSTSKSSKLEIEEFSSWICDALNIAFRYKSWRNPKDKLYHDPNGPDKVINRCLFSIRNYYYQQFNKDKRKLNYTCDSIENQVDGFGDSADAICSGATTESLDSTYTCKDVIQYLINNSKLVEAIVLDGICFQDSIKDGEINRHKLIKHMLGSNCSSYKEYFIKNYVVDEKQFNEVMDTISKMPNQKANKCVKKTLCLLQQDKEIKELLCL